MSFFKKLFTSNHEFEKSEGKLFTSLQSSFPNFTDEELIKISCVSALMGRVVISDNKIDDKELDFIKVALPKWLGFELDDVNLICSLLVDYTNEFAMMESHLVVEQLRQHYDKNELFSLVEVLFHIASSDGVVDSNETEEIRVISKALGLSHQHFISAKAKVVEYLAVLKN